MKLERNIIFDLKMHTIAFYQLATTSFAQYHFSETSGVINIHGVMQWF